MNVLLPRVGIDTNFFFFQWVLEELFERHVDKNKRWLDEVSVSTLHGHLHWQPYCVVFFTLMLTYKMAKRKSNKLIHSVREIRDLSENYSVSHSEIFSISLVMLFLRTKCAIFWKLCAMTCKVQRTHLPVVQSLRLVKRQRLTFFIVICMVWNL